MCFTSLRKDPSLFPLLSLAEREVRGGFRTKNGTTLLDTANTHTQSLRLYNVLTAAAVAVVVSLSGDGRQQQQHHFSDRGKEDYYTRGVCVLCRLAEKHWSDERVRLGEGEGGGLVVPGAAVVDDDVPPPVPVRVCEEDLSADVALALAASAVADASKLGECQREREEEEGF